MTPAARASKTTPATMGVGIKKRVRVGNLLLGEKVQPEEAKILLLICLET